MKYPLWAALLALWATQLSAAGCSDQAGQGPAGGPDTPVEASGDAGGDAPDPDAEPQADAPDVDPQPPDVPDTSPGDVPTDLGPGPEIPQGDFKTCTGNVNPEDRMPYGGACCYTGATHAQNPGCLWYVLGFDSDCLDDQCATGICSGASYCTRPCQFIGDKKNNHTGQSKPDGVADDAPINPCDGAVDGPVGGEFRCVNLNPPFEDPYGVCRPGTTFADCESSADCPQGESCQLLFVRGQLEPRCMTAKDGGAAPTEACNSDPLSGPLQPCEGPLCDSNVGCVDLCADDSSCLTDTCEGGFCGKDITRECTLDSDCSAWSCRELTPYNNDPYTDDFCYPRSCDDLDGCRDPDWFCRPYWNGADTLEEVAMTPACRPRAVDAADYGEPCGEVGDGTGLPPCVWSGGCIDNYCAGPCTDDAVCGEGAECLLGDEWGIDVDGDAFFDTWLNVDLCQPWPQFGPLLQCESDDDCLDGEHCEYRIKGEGEGAARTWKADYACRSDYEEQASYGQVCGGASGKTCKSGLCLVSSGSIIDDGMCTDYCSSHADCPQGFQFAGFTWNSICLSFPVNGSQSLDTVDDIYVPYCWRTNPTASLEPCDANLDCSSPTEYCRALPVAGNPDEPVLVEHLCLNAADGLDETPTKLVGESCEGWEECLGRNCQPDGEGGRYCSELCATDEDCVTPGGIEGLKCTDQVLIARPNPDHSGLTKRCLLEKTCLECDVDNDCGGEQWCVNAGGIGPLADKRCAAPCESDGDCTEQGTSCLSETNSAGEQTGRKSCLPLSCQ